MLNNFVYIAIVLYYNILQYTERGKANGKKKEEEQRYEERSEVCL